MKRLQWGLCAATASIAVVASIAVYQTANYLLAVNAYTLALDPLFSEHTRTGIAQYIQQTTPIASLFSKAFIHNLQEQFSCIQTVAIERCAPRTLHINVTAKVPVVGINTTAFATADGAIISKDAFADYRVSYLPVITATNLATSKTVPPTFCQHAAALAQLSKYYTVTWVDPLEIRLEDKRQPLFSIVCNATCIPDVKLLHQCQGLKFNAETQGLFVTKNPTKKLAKKLIADVRFAKQIIVYSEGKGEAYG